jgi:hypothetical protein
MRFSTRKIGPMSMNAAEAAEHAAEVSAFLRSIGGDQYADELDARVDAVMSDLRTLGVTRG